MLLKGTVQEYFIHIFHLLESLRDEDRNNSGPPGVSFLLPWICIPHMCTATTQTAWWCHNVLMYACLCVYFRNIASVSILWTQQETYLILADHVFSGIFIAELLAKWLALSIPTYFKDKWNWWVMLHYARAVLFEYQAKRLFLNNHDSNQGQLVCMLGNTQKSTIFCQSFPRRDQLLY